MQGRHADLLHRRRKLEIYMDEAPLPPRGSFWIRLRFILWLLVHPSRWEEYRVAVPVITPHALPEQATDRVTLVLLAPDRVTIRSIVTVLAHKRPDIFVRPHGTHADYYRFHSVDRYGRYAYVCDPEPEA